MLQYEEADLADFGGYDLVHHDDLSYVASAHQERKENSKKKTRHFQTLFLTQMY